MSHNYQETTLSLMRKKLEKIKSKYLSFGQNSEHAGSDENDRQQNKECLEVSYEKETKRRKKRSDSKRGKVTAGKRTTDGNADGLFKRSCLQRDSKFSRRQVENC